MQFKYDDFPITVILPEEAVEHRSQNDILPACASIGALELLERIALILGEHYRQRPTTSVAEDKNTLVDALAEKCTLRHLPP